MQVKKFEARTVKEALELVKNNLGPDAIILNVRDINNRFGLAGEGSVEVTAAVSEMTLKKKQFAESRMNDRAKEDFKRAPARVQKAFIDKMVENHTQRPAAEPRKMTARPYIDIPDEQPRRPTTGGRNVTDMLNEVQSQPQQGTVALQRIRSAARDAWNAVQDTVETTPKAQPRKSAEAEAEIQALKAEVSTLKQVIQEFREMPQKFISPHPGAAEGILYELSFMYEKLENAGLAEAHIHAILLQAQKELSVHHVKNKPMVEAWVAKHLLQSLVVKANPFAEKLHLFVGGAGQGKTATLVKAASRLVVEKRKRIAIVTTDAFKVGAVEQLRIYTQILNVPFAVIREKSDWRKVLSSLGPVDHVLADFPGLQLKDAHEKNLLQRLLPEMDLEPTTHLVVSANLKDSDASQIGRRYQATSFEDVIFTCLDESMTHGLIYNFQQEFKVPLHSFGTGPQIPENYEDATKERVLDLIFKLSHERGVA